MKLLHASVAMLAVLLAVSLAGCAGHEPVTGQVTGRLLREGSPPSGQPMPGTVAFTAAGRQRVTVRAGNSGTFSAQLPPGRYHVSGPCSQSFPVTVTAHQTVHVNVICIVPVGRPPSS
jgi:hypothetical protein